MAIRVVPTQKKDAFQTKNGLSSPELYINIQGASYRKERGDIIVMLGVFANAEARSKSLPQIQSEDVAPSQLFAVTDLAKFNSMGIIPYAYEMVQAQVGKYFGSRATVEQV